MMTDSGGLVGFEIDERERPAGGDEIAGNLRRAGSHDVDGGGGKVVIRIRVGRGGIGDGGVENSSDGVESASSA